MLGRKVYVIAKIRTHSSVAETIISLTAFDLIKYILAKSSGQWSSNKAAEKKIVLL